MILQYIYTVFTPINNNGLTNSNGIKQFIGTFIFANFVWFLWILAGFLIAKIRKEDWCVGYFFVFYSIAIIVIWISIIFTLFGAWVASFL